MIKKAELFTAKEVCRRLDIPYNRLRYLFVSRKLKKEDFEILPSGDIAFTNDDLVTIKELLFSKR